MFKTPKNSTEKLLSPNYKKLFIAQIPMHLLIFLSAFACLMIQIVLQVKTPIFFAEIAATFGLILIVNILPILFVSYFFLFLTNNLFVSLTITNTLFIFLAFANRMMVTLRETPLKPNDLYLVTELFGVLTTLSIQQQILIILLITAFTLILVIGVIFVKNQKYKAKFRWPLFFATILIFLVVNRTLYSSTDIYNAFPVCGGSYWNEVDQVTAKGVNYYFLYSFNENKVEEPPNHDENVDAITEYEEAYVPVVPPEEEMPNIIMVMVESYSDLTNSSQLDYTDYEDPMEFYNQLAEQTVSGHIVVPVIGGGTCNTEFDTITGINTRYYAGTTNSYQMINSPTKNLASVLETVGYDTIGMHPGETWFYDRQNVYTMFGFDEIYFREDFVNPEYKGGYVADTSTADMIIQQYEEQNATSDDPLFLFCVTIQNHTPYVDKFPELGQNFSTDLVMTDEQINALSNYIVGVQDSDEMMQQIVEYFSQVEEPTVVIFFGDHLPGLGKETYDMLIDEPYAGEYSRLKYYCTPYVIWSNSEEVITQEEIENEEELISSFYLGAYALELAGLGEIDPYFSYLNQMRELYPIVYSDCYFDSEYQYHEGTNPDIDTMNSYGYSNLN